MFNINKQYVLADNEGSSIRAINDYVILHESGNDNDRTDPQALLHEVQYMHNNFSNAYVQFFVGYLDGKAQVFQIGEPGYVSWGALNANPYAPVQIEFARTDTKEHFTEAYHLYINLVRYYAQVYDIPLALDQGSTATKGIKTHQWVTNNFGGDHVDPYPYFESMGISKEQLALDLQNGFNDDEEVPTVSNVVTVTDNRFKAYTVYHKDGTPYPGTDIETNTKWVSNAIVPIGNENEAFYQVSKDMFLPQEVTNFKTFITINLPKDQHAYTVDDLGEKTNDTELDATLVGGTSWKMDGLLYPMKNGVVAYLIADKRFLPVKFAQGSGATN